MQALQVERQDGVCEVTYIEAVNCRQEMSEISRSSVKLYSALLPLRYLFVFS
jgi:hypothetical protein